MKTTSTFDENYLAWKGWNSGNFAQLGREQRNWFAAQLSTIDLSAAQGAPRILEIGFGNGQFLTYCREQQWSVAGVEANEQLLMAARNAGFETIQNDAIASLPSNDFDLIAAFNVLEHIDQNQLPEFLFTMHRILKPGAILISRFPNGDSPFGLRDQHGDISHCTTLGSIKIDTLMKNAKFKVLKMGGDVEPLQGQRLPSQLRRIISRHLRKLINFIVSRFIDIGNSHFADANLIMICKKITD